MQIAANRRQSDGFSREDIKVPLDEDRFLVKDHGGEAGGHAGGEAGGHAGGDENIHQPGAGHKNAAAGDNDNDDEKHEVEENKVEENKVEENEVEECEGANNKIGSPNGVRYNVAATADDGPVSTDEVCGGGARHPLLIEKTTTMSSTISSSTLGRPSLEPPSRRRRAQPFFGQFRFCVALLLALATYSYTSMRMNLGMAMVCMVNSTAVRLKEKHVSQLLLLQQQMNSTSANNVEQHFFDDDDDSEDDCPASSIVAHPDLSKNLGYQGTLEWTAAEQARLFGATFYGSFLTVWFAGYLADRFGPKLLIGLAIADYTLVSLLSPWLVSINYNVFFLARVFMGFGEGFVMPTLAAAMARWFPPAERSLMVAICTLGNQFAALAALLLSSRLCALELLGGWPTIFYAFGLMGFACLSLWILFSSNSPNESRWIGREECKMITNSLAAGQNTISSKKFVAVPWRQLALSLPLYAGIFGQATYTFCNIILQSYLPTFFKEVVQLNLKNNGLFSVIPFVTMICSKILFGVVADLLRKRKLLSDTNTAKLFQCIANFGSAFAAICMGFFVSCRTPGLAAVFMAIWGISFGANTSGFFTQLLSIGPRFAGTITSLSTASAIVTSGLAPVVVSAIVKQGTSAEWRIIWYLIAGCNLGCAIFFLIFASAKQQKWSMNNLQEEDPKSVKSIEIRRPKLSKIVL